MFAQAIALSLPTEDRKILWLGTQVAGSALLKLYELVLMKDLWGQVLYIDLNRKLQPVSFGRMLRSPISNIRGGRVAVSAIRREIADLGGSIELWVPHQDDWSCRVAAAEVYASAGLVHFFEEGLSIYLDRERRSRVWYRDIVSRWAKAIGVGCRGAVRHPMGYYLTDIYQTCIDCDTIFDRNIRRRSLAELCGKSYTDRLLAIPSFGTVVGRLVAKYPTSPFVLFVNSVDVEDNYISLDDYVESVRRGIGAAGFGDEVIMIKPHPRNRKETIQALVAAFEGRSQVVDEDVPVPIEVIAPLLNLKAVVGTNTSALVYLKIIHGIETISISGLMAGDGPMFHRNVNFSRTFSTIVRCI